MSISKCSQPRLTRVVWRVLVGTLGICLSLSGGVASAQQIVDQAGRTVEVPAKAERIADAWYAHHSLLMTLGAGSHIVATVLNAQTRPWMFKVQPSLNRALSVSGNSFNAESLLARKVDVVFIPKGDRNADALQQQGLAVVEVGASDQASIQQAILLTARILGTPQAMKRAQDYNHYLQQTMQTIRASTAAIPPAKRPRVLHIASLAPIKVDGSNTVIDGWIQAAGGRNAASGVRGNMQVVSVEQLMLWQPDVIILAADAGPLQKAPDAAMLASLRAVRQGQVWRNPAGVFPWDRYGSETALQLQWVAQKLHPKLFANLDMRQKTRAFYRRFFDYPLTDSEASRILAGLPPQ